MNLFTSHLDCEFCGNQIQDQEQTRDMCYHCSRSVQSMNESWIKQLPKLADGCSGPSSLYVRLNKWIQTLDVDSNEFAKVLKEKPTRKRVAIAASKMGLFK